MLRTSKTLCRIEEICCSCALVILHYDFMIHHTSLVFGVELTVNNALLYYTRRRPVLACWPCPALIQQSIALFTVSSTPKTRRWCVIFFLVFILSCQVVYESNPNRRYEYILFSVDLQGPRTRTHIYYVYWNPSSMAHYP